MITIVGLCLECQHCFSRRHCEEMGLTSVGMVCMSPAFGHLGAELGRHIGVRRLRLFVYDFYE